MPLREPFKHRDLQGFIANPPDPFRNSFIADLTRSRDLRLKDFSLQFNTPFFIDAAGGREYGAWMTGARIAAITDATVAAASAIENAVGVIESIIEDDLNDTFSITVDTDSFDAAYDDRRADDGWICDVSVFEQIGAIDFINDICKQFHMKLWFDPVDDNVKIKAFDTSRSIDYTFHDAENYGTNKSSVHGGRIFGSESLQPMDLEMVYNDFEINYGYDYGSGKYKSIRYLNASEENFDQLAGAVVTILQGYCTNANDRYHVNKKFVVDAPAIQDDETAENCLMNHIFKRTFRPYLVNLVTGPEGHLIELGDFIVIISENTKSLWSTGFDSMTWDVYSHRYIGNGMYEISAIEVTP